MPIRSRLEIEGLPAATRRFDDIGLRARRPEPALRSKATLGALKASEQRRFARGGWPRDTPKWIREKRRRGLSDKTLVATGRLERALESGAVAEGISFSAYDSTLYWGIKGGRTNIYYAHPLAKGVGHKKVKRRMVTIDRQARVVIVTYVQNYIATGYAGV
jgi:hypothetical protein